MITALAPAKLNLGLRVLSRRPDGYHEIETVFVPLRLFDRLTFESSTEAGVHLSSADPALPRGEDNLAVRAAVEASRALGIDPAIRIRLEKHIPMAAGLGGGSSDAAITVLGVEALAGRALEPSQRRALALGLGADVPFFLDPKPAIGRGVGEQLEPIARLPELAWVVVALPFEISTADAYQAASSQLTLPREPSSIAALLGPSGVPDVPTNDLEAIARRRFPPIGEAQRALLDVGARVTGMSGSGPTVYGNFDTPEAAESAARRAILPKGAKAIPCTSPGSESSDWGWGVAKW